jgi:hypothetical protein
MLNRKRRIIGADCVLIATVCCVTAPSSVFAQDDLSAELRRCRLIDNGPARLDCYDVLSGRKEPASGESAGVQQEAAAEPDRRNLDQEAVDVTASDQATVREEIPEEQTADMIVRDQKPAEEEVAVEAAADTKTLDDLGSETLPRGSRDEDEKLEVRATVSRCERDFRKKYRFYFDNGQIWKQTSDKRPYFRACDFDVTITKDFFGYKMKVDGEKRQIRISRVQ